MKVVDLDKIVQLRSLRKDLCAPFPPEAIDLKPVATSDAKTRALAAAYGDLRAYQDRLDTLVGIDNWTVKYRPIGIASMFCRLTILGVSKEDVGEAGEEDTNKSTIALAQSFKRAACAFGIGRYLYGLPQLWFSYNGKDKEWGEPVPILVRKLYRAGGIAFDDPIATLIKEADGATNLSVVGRIVDFVKRQLSDKLISKEEAERVAPHTRASRERLEGQENAAGQAKKSEDKADVAEFIEGINAEG